VRPADAWIDPSQPKDRAWVTHGHGDHARGGHGAVLATRETLAIMEVRYGPQRGQPIPYDETIRVGDVDVCFVPAGHVLGSSQIVMEHKGERIVVSGNFLLDSESRMKVTAVTPASVTGDVKAAKDPVCGMGVDPDRPHAIRAQHGGKAHFFCSDQCRKKFEANPARYLPKAIAAQEMSGRRGPG
jgi:YHS domain-containing protein